MAQFGTLLNKNWLYWKRDTGCCCCQIGTSVVFALFLVLIKALSSSSKVDVDETFYLGKYGGDMPIPTPKLNSITSDADVINQYANFVKTTKFSTFKDCNYKGDENRKKNGGYVALVSKNTAMLANLETFFTEVGFTTKRLERKEDIDAQVIMSDYGSKLMPDGIPDTICLGITFDEDSGNKWSYNFHFNTTGNIDLPNQEKPVLFREEDTIKKDIDKYFSSGILVLQGLIDNLILRSASGTSTANIQARFVKMPVPKYSDNGLYTVTNNGQIETYIIFPLLVIYLGFIYHMLKEKEKKITENLRNMGMSLLPHYLSWFAFYTLVLIGCSIVWLIIVKLSFFPHSNVILVWLLYMLPGLVLLALAFIVCAFFITAKPGVLFGIISFFALYTPSIAKGTVSDPSESIYTWFALSPFTGLSLSASNVVMLESLNNYGFGFEHVGITINYFKFSTFIIITIIEIVVFFFIGIYLDQVWPTEIGIKKHPLFCLGKSKQNSVDYDNGSPVDDTYRKENYEPLSQEMIEKKKELENTIQIKNLRKVYSNGKVAVHNLSLDIFDNQIFALLGHNGAGKTTTISMISGLLTQTTGTIEICGFDTKTHYDEIKKKLGVCPQLNPIYDNLTCREHLLLYGNIKLQGERQVTEEEIDQILTDIDLIDKKNFVAGRLSGGQKRKLCIGVAFIGGSKVILLDEPTSGMDTYARRYLWEMIKKYKKDRIIILCTHYMDEADFLGDRFGIMGEGRLITCGSSLFLKKRFGVGYDLTIVKEHSHTSTAYIEKLVKSKVPSAELTGDISMEIKFRLPNEQSSMFEELFADLEDKKDVYGIQSFGISLTTLEEVFLKVAVGIGHHGKGGEEEGRVETQEDPDFELEHIRIKGIFEIFKMHFKALCRKRFIYFKRDYKGLFCEILLPIIIITLGLCFTLINFVKDPTPRSYIVSTVYENGAKAWGNTPSLAANIAEYKNIYDKFTGISKFSFDKRVDVSNPVDFQDALVKTRMNDRYMSYYISSIDTTNKAYDYIAFYNTTVASTPVVSANLMNNAILKTVVGDDSYIKVNLNGMKLTKQIKSFEDTADGLIAVFLFSLAYAFIPAGVVLFIVKERESNAKHQQIVSGVSVYAYWLSNLLIDVCKYLIPGIYCALSILIFGVGAFTHDDHYSLVWVIILLYGPAIMSFTYLTSFMFTSAESAQIATFVANFLAGFILIFLSLAFRLIKSTRDMAVYFPELILRFFPTYDFAWGLFEVSNTQLWQLMYKLSEKPMAWTRWGGLLNVIYLIFLPFICMGMIFYIELKSHKVDLQDHDARNLVDLTAGDEDVRFEREEVSRSEDYAIEVKDFVKEYKMISKQGGCCSSKLMTSKVAVKGVTFGVKKGECFGLLGTNGAGKTTTFKALSGEIVPTYGVTKIGGYDLSKDMAKARHLIGYCPQFDALLDNLTAREHLELFAAIKGIPEHMWETLIQNKLEQLNLKSFEHVQAGTYSGGNKRKLSVAIALIGNPPIILLDEPSSGMDPEARRFMWSVVGKISTEKKHSSVVLTTHSMEEAEALSSKLAIMVEGAIECIGPVQKLKSKYGKGFEVETKIALPTIEEINQVKTKLSITGNNNLEDKDVAIILDRMNLTHLRSEVKQEGIFESIYQQLQSTGSVSQELFFNVAILQQRVRHLEEFLVQKFGSYKLIESVNAFYRYQLPEGLRISKLFGELERNQQQLKLAQYSVKQTSIEQIFIGFANQRNVPRDE